MFILVYIIMMDMNNITRCMGMCNTTRCMSMWERKILFMSVATTLFISLSTKTCKYLVGCEWTWMHCALESLTLLDVMFATRLLNMFSF